MKLATLYPIEIISADSMQVYRYMDIGTDKVTVEQMSKVKHHLIDIRYPDEPWSVRDFQCLASQAITCITSKERIPCIVGGTGFYIRALLHNFPLEDAPPDPGLRARLKSLARRYSNSLVHNMLKRIDRESYKNLHPNDLKRVIRAVEYYRATGRPISQRTHLESDPIYDYKMIGLHRNRKELYERIDNRVDEQFKRGLIAEVENLMNLGYEENLPSMQGLGYKEVWWMLKGLATLDETKSLLKRNTRRFAKRQLTWFSREEGIIWLSIGKHKSQKQLIEQICNLIDGWIEPSVHTRG